MSNVPAQRATADFDHHSPEFAAAPFEALREMRERCPVVWSAHHDGFWTVLTHETGLSVLRHWERFSNAKSVDDDGTVRGGIVIPSNPTLHLIPDEMDPPRWRAYRRLLNPYFAPAAVEARRHRWTALVDGLLDEIVETGRADLIMDLANPGPALITLDTLGLDCDEVELYSLPFHEVVAEPAGSQGWQRAVAGFARMSEHLARIVDQRRSTPKDDFISDLIRSEIDGEPMQDDAIVQVIMNLLGGGVDTTTALLANVFVQLDDEPQTRHRLATDQHLLRTATEEYIRYFSPVLAIARSAASRTTLRGQEICPRDRVLVSIGSMNRDSAVFDDPDMLILDRSPNRHAGFGLGIHRCLGSNFARLTFQIILAQVLTRIPDYRIDRAGATKYAQASSVNGWGRLPASFTPGARITRRTAGPASAPDQEGTQP